MTAAETIAQHALERHATVRRLLESAGHEMRRAVTSAERAEFPARITAGLPGALQLRNIAGLLHEAAEAAEAAERLERVWLVVSVQEGR